jgi:hypothetical protein
MDERQKSTEPKTDESRDRRPYRRPALVELGSVRELTRSGGMTTTDGFGKKKGA